MRESSEKVKNSALIFGNYLNIEEATILLIKNVGLHSAIKELIYIAFTKNIIDYFMDDDVVYKAVQILRKYCIEMSLNGEVIFDEENNK